MCCWDLLESAEAVQVDGLQESRVVWHEVEISGVAESGELSRMAYLVPPYFAAP
jgi:hypothetical protein